MTGEEFLQYSAKVTGIATETDFKRTTELLKTVGIDDAKDKRIHNYSSGMQQRLRIAQAIMHLPSLLVLDESVSDLYTIGRREVLDLLETLKKELTILFSTHILSDADEVSDDLILLDHGRVVEADSMINLRKKYQTAKIELTFESDLTYYKQQISKLDSVINSKIVRNLLHITVSNIEQARTEILATAVTNNWPLTNFAINRTSLEDMFMKAVHR